MLSAFAKTNLKSRKIRSFFILLCILIAFYIAGWGFYAFQNENVKAKEMLHDSLVSLVLTVLFTVFLWLLRWQLLRTIILATLLLSLAYLYCAVILLVVESQVARAIILVTISILFSIGFVLQSNILIYIKDTAYADTAIEITIVFSFLILIGLMILKALKGN